jgi:hypothetical protein
MADSGLDPSSLFARATHWRRQAAEYRLQAEWTADGDTRERLTAAAQACLRCAELMQRLESSQRRGLSVH